MALALVWLKLTVALAPMLKLCQLIAAFCEDWSIFKVLLTWRIEALPAVTKAPTGNAFGSKAWASLKWISMSKVKQRNANFGVCIATDLSFIVIFFLMTYQL